MGVLNLAIVVPQVLFLIFILLCSVNVLTICCYCSPLYFLFPIHYFSVLLYSCYVLCRSLCSSHISMVLLL